MANRQFTPDPEAAQRKRQEAIDRLTHGLETVATSDGFRAWLRTASKFHSYSFGNQILIWIQRPDATRVAGFRAWSDVGRYVRKGAKGISIMVPHVYKARPADDDADDADAATARPRVRFGIGYVFDVADTDGAELPTLGYQMIEGETSGELWQRIAAVADGLGVPLACDARPVRDGIEGYFDPLKGEIWYRPELTLDGRSATVLHELGHVLDHRAHADAGEPFDYRNHRGDRETVAEAVAYVAADHFGLDTGSASFTYLASWARDQAVLKARLGEIQAISDRLITALEGADASAALVA